MTRRGCLLRSNLCPERTREQQKTGQFFIGLWAAGGTEKGNALDHSLILSCDGAGGSESGRLTVLRTLA